MKKLFIIPFLFLTAASFAQKGNTADTLTVIKDPLNTGREFHLNYTTKGVLTSQGFIRNGKKDGLWRFYSPENGTMTRMGEFSKDVPNGALVNFERNGMFVKDSTVLNNKPAEWHTADTIVVKDELNPGREFKVIHKADSSTRSQGFWMDGKKDGVWRDYTDWQSHLSKVEDYSKGNLNGASVTMLQYRGVSLDETFFNGKLEGVKVTMYQTGGQEIVEHYKAGILDGIKKRYYDNGQLQEEGDWRNGQRTGPTKWYKKDGSVFMEYTYANGILQGPTKEYDDKGKIKRTGQYVNNLESGEWKVFEDSVMVQKIIYKNGVIAKEIPVKK